jgi:hypothetical protein
MPVTGTFISSAIKANMTPRSIKGRDAGSLADAIGLSVATHVTTPNMVTCTLSGSAGPTGTITSLAVAGIVGKSMSGLMAVKAQTKKLTGRDILTLFDAISSGIAQVLMGSILSGSCIGCGVGVGTGKFLALNDKALSGLIVLNASSRAFRGRNIVDLADCIAFGVVNHLKSSATFSVLVAGAISPTPPTGPVAVTGIPSVTTKVS